MMSQERRGEIALLYLKNEQKRNGIKLIDIRRRVNGTAKEIGINESEAFEFAETLVRELVDEAFPSK